MIESVYVSLQSGQVTMGWDAKPHSRNSLFLDENR